MDNKTIIQKIKSAPKTRLKIYRQDFNEDIESMLSGLMYNVWSDLGGGKLSDCEIEHCSRIFRKAIITNQVNTEAIESLKELFSETLAAFNGNVDDVFRSQLLKECGMYEPGPRCFYTADDIIAAARKYLDLRAQGGSPKEKKTAMSGILASIGSYFTGNNVCFVALNDEKDFEKLKTISNQILKRCSDKVIPDDYTLADKLYDGFILRNNYVIDNASNEPCSLARIMMAVLTNNFPTQILPSKTIEGFLPSVLLFFNIKELANAVSARIQKVKKELDTLKSLDKSRLLSFREIAGLDEIIRNTQKYVLGKDQLDSPLADPVKTVYNEKFRLESLSMSRVKDKLIKIEKKMKDVMYSRNPNKEYEVETFQRPNRRNPLDPDLPGMYQELGCYPDIHLYVDTSGSIQQKDYEGSISIAIDIAKKLHCDLYFNSFSHCISQETVVPCRNRTKGSILNMISKIPKVSGGTTLDQVWSYIDQNEKNRKQLSIVISDFEVDVPRYMQHPKYLFYIPIKNPVKKYVETFVEGLDHTWRMLH